MLEVAGHLVFEKISIQQSSESVINLMKFTPNVSKRLQASPTSGTITPMWLKPIRLDRSFIVIIYLIIYCFPLGSEFPFTYLQSRLFSVAQLLQLPTVKNARSSHCGRNSTRLCQRSPVHLVRPWDLRSPWSKRGTLLEYEILKSDFGFEVMFPLIFVFCGGSLDSCSTSSLEISCSMGRLMVFTLMLND